MGLKQSVPVQMPPLAVPACCSLVQAACQVGCQQRTACRLQAVSAVLQVTQRRDQEQALVQGAEHGNCQPAWHAMERTCGWAQLHQAVVGRKVLDNTRMSADVAPELTAARQLDSHM